MSKFFIGDETFRVSFPDGEWVDIKQEFSQADYDYITTKMMQADISIDEKNKPKTDLSMRFGKQATLERAIVAWSFIDDKKPVPITSENISNLRYKYRSIVLQEIDRLDRESRGFLKN